MVLALETISRTNLKQKQKPKLTANHITI